MRPLTPQERQEIRTLGYDEWVRQQRYRSIAPSIIRVIQLCYQAGMTDHNAIRDEVIRILRLPKCHEKEDSRTIDYLIPEVLSDAKVRLKILNIRLKDPFESFKRMNVA